MSCVLLGSLGRYFCFVSEMLMPAGESNLKIRRPVNLKKDTPNNAQEAVDLNAVLTCEPPNPDLHTFLGKLTFHPSSGVLTEHK